MKSTPLIAGIGLVAVIVLGWWALGGKSEPAPIVSEEGEGEEIAVSAEEGVFNGSMTDLIKRGGNFMCTFSHSSAVAQSTGTVYISGSDIRGDFQSKTQGINVESHMIQKEGYIYTWSPMTPTGFKIKAVEGDGDSSASMSAQYSDMNQDYAYDCKMWSRTADKFALPNITFTAVN